MSTEKKIGILRSGTGLLCPKCKGDYKDIDETCLECMKRYHKYRYETVYGLREQYDEYLKCLMERDDHQK